ncbi:hypothetical protein Tco_0829485 [Tanacetum coccineum]
MSVFWIAEQYLKMKPRSQRNLVKKVQELRMIPRVQFWYLTTVGHTKASAIFTASLNFMRMKCQSKSKSANWGVYAMRHMETYMGNMKEKCECGLDVDGRKHTSQINKLRVKYAAKILLSSCNIHHKKVGDLLNGK